MQLTPSSSVVTSEIRKARGTFACMATAYFLGVFNDNFFKQAAMMLAVAAGRSEMQGYALMAFTLPFLVFAAPAGWCSDRFSKHHVVIAAKWIELVAMLFGAAGLLAGNWILIFAMLTIMGLQAALFSPALNGSLPELYPEAYVPRANGVLRVLITVGILAGIGIAGVLLDRPGTGWWGVDVGRLLVAGTVVGMAVLGVAVSYGVVRRPAADPAARFPWTGPIHTVGDLLATRQDPLLALSIGANVFVWFLGSLQILLINPMGLQQFHLSKAMTSALLVSQLVGLGAGGLASSRLVHGARWYRLVGPLGMGLAVTMGGVSTVPLWPAGLQLPLLFSGVFLLGLLGGAMIVPMESFLQVRPRRERKGAVWAAANFVVFGGILLSGLAANQLNARWAPTASFGILGVGAMIVSLILLALYRREGRREVKEP
jgi:acyl-[acyl-carrier-protein]-phospholipid O-acyltransferase/long-chain-fatty-acid--[acyl-carrier-protein] ligase